MLRTSPGLNSRGQCDERMNAAKRPVLFGLFFVSGFCGLVYQVVWTRLAFASFGIITPVLSVVISVFMLGLAAGSWVGGRTVESWSCRLRLSPIALYALAEAGIGLGAFMVPRLFVGGERLLLSAGQANSLVYLVISALVLALSIFPWCFCMGTTFPFMMAYVRGREGESKESFSYLYLANVPGAMAGALVTALALVELFGFKDTLRVASSGNFLIALVSLWIARDHLRQCARANPSAAPSGPESSTVSTASFLDGNLRTEVQSTPANPASAVPDATSTSAAFRLWLLFTTGFSSMAMEVVWTRYFAPVLKTQVYSFAMVVAAYLAATFAGSLLYRHHLRHNLLRTKAQLIAMLCASSLLPVFASDPHFVRTIWYDAYPHIGSMVLTLASIVPFCAVLGYLTPGLIDEHSTGSPRAAGSAYAVNVLGCILGPLFACYVLLPSLSERWSVILLTIPFLLFYWAAAKRLSPSTQLAWATPTCLLLVGAVFWAGTFEETILRLNKNAVVRRDYAASVLSSGTGARKVLLVNGFGMTRLTPITKFMSHLPLAFHGQPKSALVICFGMGTSFRSALSWDIDTTAVELIPGVRDAFPYYHEDAPRVLQNPKGKIVVDDGRRFLARTRGQFDAIIIDPPPPLESAGSSLLYSREFYQAAKRRMTSTAVLQAWIPADVQGVETAALRSIVEEFPYVRCFGSMEGWGLHVLASLRPIPDVAAGQFLERMPRGARQDLLEWTPTADPVALIQKVLGSEKSVEQMLSRSPNTRITDDEPYNEYFMLRYLGVL